MTDLFSSYRPGPLELSNPLVIAPMTRSRAQARRTVPRHLLTLPEFHNSAFTELEFQPSPPQSTCPAAGEKNADTRKPVSHILG
jgi:hypothetical protein